ncbi:MAG: AAA family ATPase [Chloroflexi bacterium]|nr:AAA family ATPase [Chloroflexota bacterium]
MRLRSIELHGYKSFAARTALQFDSPLTAVVGPNGSGKSNVMDGLRWAIGAGSGRALRTRRAEDVVFTGGRDRAPSGFAEVRVQLDNSDRWLDLDAAEIELVRRVHRDGQSELRINGRAARLRDVQDLFRNSGLGSGGFALMSQGLVDEMLRLRPLERRQAIEEVSGVRQHRHQMEESRRRRERAQEHLERARLLRDELSPRLKSLERAARRSRQAQKLRLQLTEAQREYFFAASAESDQELLVRRESAASAATVRTNAETERASATDALGAVEREAAAARRAVEAADETIRGARTRLRTLEHQQELDQQQRSWLAREIGDLAGRVQAQPDEGVEGDVESAARALAEASRTLSSARERRDRIERSQATAIAQRRRSLAEIAEIAAQARQLSRRWRASAAQIHHGALELSTVEAEHHESEQTWQQAETLVRDAELRVAARREEQQGNRRRRADLSSRIDEIAAQVDSLERRVAAANTLRARVYELTADHVRADAIFGELMDATLHESPEEASESVRRVVDGDAGRAIALPKDRADELIRATLQAVESADTLEQARISVESNRTAAMPDGIVFRPDGVVLGGGSLPGAARLRRQIDQLRAERATMTRELDSIPAGEQVDQHVTDAEQALRQLTEAREIARLEAEQARELLETLRRRRGAALALSRGLRLDVERLRVALAEARVGCSQAELELADSGDEGAPDLAALERRRDVCAAVLAEARALAATAERTRADRARLGSLRRELVEVESTIRAREPQLEAAASTADDTTARDATRERLAALEQRRAEAVGQVERAQEARLVAERRAVESDASLRETETARARLEAEAAAEGIDLSIRHRHSQSTLEPIGSAPVGNGAGRHVERSSGAPASAVALAVAEPRAPTVSQLHERMQDLQQKLQRLGPVDPGAASEYDAEHGRWRDIEAQIDDLEQTERSLREAERDLEQQIERRFRDACRRVDEAFQRYFQLMFRGGRAELVLAEESSAAGEDAEPETQTQRSLGVDIRAQPPGKRVSTLGLLSGGERALTAIALLFALLEVRPAPFCILDEVDAALDEANVERFVNALKERARETQFVVITHNRRTIEQADSIYGVTMGAAGVSRLLSVKVDQAIATAS